MNISPSEDVDGEDGGYAEWFKNYMNLDDVVLIRPDFYVFGHCRVAQANTLVQQLQAKIKQGIE